MIGRQQEDEDRRQVASKVWNEVKRKASNYLNTFSNKPASRKKYIIVLCFGYGQKEMTSETDLMAMISEIQAKNETFILYLSPKDEAAQKEWFDVHPRLIKLAGEENIRLISDWRKDPAWRAASALFDQYRNGDNTIKVNDALSKAMNNFRSRHKEIPQEKVEEHVINEAIDCLSWYSSEEVEPNSVDVNVLFYKNSLTPLMHHVMQSASKIGYDTLKSTLVHVKFEFENVPEEVYTCSSQTAPVAIPNRVKPNDEIDLVCQILQRSKAYGQDDPKWAGAFAAAFCKTMREPALSQSHSPEQQEFPERVSLGKNGNNFLTKSATVPSNLVRQGIFAGSNKAQSNNSVIPINDLTSQSNASAGDDSPLSRVTTVRS